MLVTISHVTMKTLLLVPGLYTPNSDLCEGKLFKVLASGKYPILDIRVNML